MPQVLPQKTIDDAAAAVAFAQQVRKFHRRRSQRNSAQRKRDIALALKRLSDAMVPLKSQIGQFPYGPQTTVAEQNRERIRQASAAIQVERRKLWKMKNPTKRRTT